MTAVVPLEVAVERLAATHPATHHHGEQHAHAVALTARVTTGPVG